MDDAGSPQLPGHERSPEKAAGHWLLARVGKRVLRPGGRETTDWLVSQLTLQGKDVGDEVKDDIRRALATAIRVNARPMTVAEWQALADQAGFDVVATRLAPMALLKPQRMIADEGVPRTLKIAFNVLRQPKIRKRILGMRAVFNRYSDQLRGIGMVLRRREENQ